MPDHTGTHRRSNVRIGVLRIFTGLAAMLIAAVPTLAAAPPATCDTAGIVARALPSVVNISVARVLRPEPGSDPQTKDRLAFFVGSGAIVDPRGIIVTNQHVIQDAAMIMVTFHDKTQVPAKLIGAAALIDLAVLKVDVPQALPVLPFGDSDALHVGEPVIAIGNPLGLGTSVSTGVISAKDRNLMKTPFDDFIQTDASINPGNSGGPLLDCNGQIVGIDSALLSNNKVEGSIGIGFALPGNEAKFVTAKLLDPEHPLPDWIGLQLQDMTPMIAKAFKFTGVEGAIVTGVEKGGPAARAELAPGDIITAVDGRKLGDARDILRAVVMKPPPAPIVMTVIRQGQTRDITVRGEPWPRLMQLMDEVLASKASVARGEAAGVGLHVTAITPDDRKRYELGDASGLLVDRVIPGSQADSVGLKQGDVVMQVGDEPAKSPAAVQDRLRYGNTKSGDVVALLVRSKGNTKWWLTLYVGHIDATDLVAALPPQGFSQPAKEAAAPQR